MAWLTVAGTSGVPPPAPSSLPLDALTREAGLDQFVQAALAEREVRTGYEGQLVAALTACTSP